MPTFYISASGNDSWPGTRAKPLATLEGARNAIRKLSKDKRAGKPVNVVIGAGSYFLDRPFVLRPRDSGAAAAPVTFCAAEGEEVIISGGKRIDGWAPGEINGKKCWVTVIPEVKGGTWYFAQLFVNGERRHRARLPREGFYQIAELPDMTADTHWNQGQKRFRCAPGDIKNWRNMQDIEVLALHLWAESRLPIASFDEADCVVDLAKTSHFRLTQDHAGNGSRYYVENVREAVAQPGEWYLDRSTGELFYIPRRGEKPDEVEVIAPRLEQLVRIEGTESRPISEVRFENLTFSHTEWWLPEDMAGMSQAAIAVPAVIHAENATGIRIDNCEICHCGNYGVEFTAGCRRNAVTYCDIWDMGAGGVKMDEGSAFTTVTDCDIHHLGEIFHSAVGVWIGKSDDNCVVHNDIHDLYYSGVSVGWSWGYAPSSAARNVIEYNHIHHIGKGMLSDMGGVYTLGDSPGTRVCHNLIHDVTSDTYGGWGLYTDEGSTGIILANNVVYNTKTGGFHQHYGKENVLVNNIFVFDQSNMINRTRNEEHITLNFQRNIVVINNGSFLGGNWEGGAYRIDQNLYWDVRGTSKSMGPMTIKQWQKAGNDVHSIFADPRFVDPKKGDFSLKPDSPAWEIGFQPIDTSTVGPRRK